MEQHLKTNKYKIIFLFSGQGSHYRGMGEQLYKENRTFARSLEKSDQLVKKYLRRSVIDEIYQNKAKDFDDLLITHPAIVAIELAMLDVMYELEIFPDYVSGHSLGEFSSAVASGIWTKEMAIEYAIEQATMIVQTKVKGGMIAIINEAKSNLEPFFIKNNLFVASENFATHFTLSGEKDKIDDFQDQLTRWGIQFYRLQVAYPFHCPVIEKERDGYYYTGSELSLNNSFKGFISGLYCEERINIPNDYFWNVVSKPTDFTRFVKFMEQKGPCLYIDLGPSGTSATFVKYNLSGQSDSIVHQIMTPFKREESQLKLLSDILSGNKQF